MGRPQTRDCIHRREVEGERAQGGIRQLPPYQHRDEEVGANHAIEAERRRYPRQAGGCFRR